MVVDVAIDCHRGIVEQTKLIDQHIKDPKKHDRLMTQMDRMDVVLRDLAVALEKQSAQVQVLMLDFDATAEDFDLLGVGVDAEQKKALDKVLEIRGAMRRLMTQEEWARTSRRRYKLLAY